jgi:hypothetical protein
MPDPILLAVAGVVAAKGAEAAIAGGRDALAALTALVRRKLRATRQGSAALAAASADPDDPRQRERLATVLAELVATDPEFGLRLRQQWTAVNAEADGVANQFSGTAGGPVVQARDIHGDISF